MTNRISPLAGTLAPRASLVNVTRLVTAYYSDVPDPTVAAQRVAFGTSGHRGSAFDSSFNEWHVLAITQAICNYRKFKGITGPLFLGVDTHALSQPACESALEVLAANGVDVMLATNDEYTPTPAISHAILTHNHGRRTGLADGIVVTPSHNPPRDGGFKYNPPHGGPADQDVTDWIEAAANRFLETRLEGVQRISHAAALQAATTHRHDFLDAYVGDLGSVIDMDLLRDSKIEMGVDPLGGAGVHYWAAIADRYQLNLTVINDVVDPTFGFMPLDWDGKIRMDPSSRYAMQGLQGTEDRFDIAFACDTDHDRYGIFTRSAGLMAPNHYLAVAIDYLFHHRPQWGTRVGVGKTVVSSQMIDRVTARLGRKLVEVPVGFKWFVAGLYDGSLGFCGEESAGATFLRRDGTIWTTDKDGIAAALLSGEITARTRRDPAELYVELTRELGNPIADRVDAPADALQKTRMAALSPQQIAATSLAGEKIDSVINTAPGNGAPIGGIKVSSAGGWFAARPSGTENIVKIYAESFSGTEHLQRLLHEAQTIVDQAIALEPSTTRHQHVMEYTQAVSRSVSPHVAKQQPPVPQTHMCGSLSPDLLQKMHAYWRAANYISVGQIYLQDNPLLDSPLLLDHVKPRLLGHWGTTPGLNLLYVHLNRLIKQNDLNMIYVIGPGHGGPGIVAQTYLEGSYTEHYPAIERNRHGLQRLFRQFSWPYGIPSHVSPETPGSIHEGGELGYSLAHAYGAAFDNPDLIVACVVGDGEAETGALAASWHSNKFLNPARDGAVLPILHLNGYKIANPTVLARISREELTDLLRGYGHEPHYVEGDDPMLVHQSLAATLDTILVQIQQIQSAARALPDTESPQRPRWPMIVLCTPKGWTGPKFVDGKPVEGTWRAHQVPIAELKTPEHLKQLEDWLQSYRPQELFDERGRFREELAALAPTGHRRMGSNPHANGGALLQSLEMPGFREYAVKVDKPGSVEAEATRVLGTFLRDVMKRNLKAVNFRLFGPDETASNRLEAMYEVSGKEWMADLEDGDNHLSANGRVMEVLSEHLCQGWLEGYLLTGRHGLFSCYEAFIHIIDSMLNQHAKWLKVCNQIPWRKPVASLNYLLTSHVWRQDHNGFSHQDPGFIDHVANKKSDVVRIYLPPDANCLLSVADHCLRSRNYVNLIIAGKQPSFQWLDMESAVRHCTAGAGIWQWASNDADDPDVVMACAGDVPTLEALAAVTLLRTYIPDIRIRFVNVIDLMVLQPRSAHPHGLEDHEFDALFTTDRPVIFAFHGYPAMIHKLTYRRHNHDNIHVRGYREEGTTTTAFDMVVLNNLDRYQLALDAIQRIPRLSDQVELATARYWTAMERHKLYISEHGDDLPEVRDWRWSPG
jgi:xylulose-5-phosphate/fructose-6-phosphate phosphoketolase